MKTGLFIQSYEITTGLVGVPTFEVHLAVNTHQRSISGQGIVFNKSTHPHLEIYSNLSEEFSNMTVVSDKMNIIVNLRGQGFLLSVLPIEMLNTKVTLILDSNWQRGTANYSYVDELGNWNEIRDAKVTAVLVKELVNNN